MASLNTLVSPAEASSSSAGPTTSPATRPVTSKARGVCKYYTDPRGCYAKDNCKFLHSEPPKEGDPPVFTPYDSSKTCKFYRQGFCKRGDKCWFKHTESKEKGKGPDALEEEDDLCSICFEKPMIYGLLSGCSHIFCINCIKQWRDPSNKPGSVIESGNTKRCPMCRESSRFITPSSKFWRDDSPEKLKTIEAYRESMAKVQCRYFQKSLLKDKNKPLCPFGKDCFYQHKKEDGTLHEFKDGAEVSLRRYHARRSGSHNTFNFLGGFDYDGETVIPFLGGLDFDHFRATATANRTSATATLRQGQMLHDALITTTLEALRTHVAQHATTLRDRLQTPLGADSTPSVDNAGTARNRNNRAAGGPDASRPPRPGGIPRPPETDDMFHLIHLMDILRDQLGSDQPTANPAPPAPSTGTRAPEATAAGSRTATRNGTAIVADADEESDDDEPPPHLIPEERPRRSPTRVRTGYDSDNSMPALQVVSDSSDEEDNDGTDADDVSEDGESHDGDEDEDQFGPGMFNADLFFRELFGVPLDAPAPELRPRSHIPSAESRPNSSARFSTVVDRSAGGSGGASANRSTPVGSSPGTPGAGLAGSMRLMEWANSVLAMDEREDSDDDDEPMPPLEPIPHDTTPPSSSSASLLPTPVVSTSNQDRGSASLQQTQQQVQSQHRDAETESDSPPPLIDTLASIPSSSRQPSAHHVLSSPSTVQVESGPVSISAEGAPLRMTERKVTVQQEFTTDGRGRVISIGGPELPASVSFAEPQVSDHHLGSRSDAGEEPVEEAAEDAPLPPAPVAMQRKSSEFTTDGRGRVISVGHSASSGSSGASGMIQEGERSTEVIDNQRQEPRRDRDGEDGGNGRGLLAWFNALF